MQKQKKKREADDAGCVSDFLETELLYKWPVGHLAVEGQTPGYSLLVTKKWLMERNIPLPASVTWWLSNQALVFQVESNRHSHSQLPLNCDWIASGGGGRRGDKARSNGRAEVLRQHRVRYLSACSGSDGKPLLKALAATHLQSFSFKETLRDSRLPLMSFSRRAATSRLFLPSKNKPDCAN